MFLIVCQTANFPKHFVLKMICINNFNETHKIIYLYLLINSNWLSSLFKWNQKAADENCKRTFKSTHNQTQYLYIMHAYKEMRKQYMNTTTQVNLQVHTIKRNLYIYVHAYACIILKLVIITIIVFWVTVTFGSSHYMMVFIKRRVRYFFVIYFILVMF